MGSMMLTFDGPVTLDPAAIAIAGTDTSWTYEDLDSAAASVAAMLRASDVAPGDTIAVVANRDHASIAALLGVTRAHAAFLAVDPMLPAARQTMIVDDSGAHVVLAPQGWRTTTAHRVLPLPERTAKPSSLGTSDPPPPDDAIACLVYTSGSTGLPKAARIRHCGLRAAAAAQRALIDISPRSRVYQMATVSFDAFIFELLLALTNGATLVLPGPQAGYPGPAALARMRAAGVTHLMATPTALAAMDPAGLDELAVVFSAGERCTAHVRDTWLPGRQLINVYGPTETTIWATCESFAADTDPTIIGRPIPGVTALVLDADRSPVRSGESGELFLAGPTLAAGYHRRPDLTAERFLPLPGTDGDARMYATGDWVQLLGDGRLRFVGRMDHQVKIRGARVEPAEVENAIRDVPGVRQVAVVPYTGPDGALALGGVYTTAPAGPEPAAVSAALRARLPSWLVPTRLVRLGELPVSATGKADAHTLADLLAVAPDPRDSSPDDSSPDDSSPDDRELTPLAELVLSCTRELLGAGRIGLDDGFAEAGGNSMQALELANRVGGSLGVLLELGDLFSSASIADWVNRIEAQLCDEGERLPLPGLPLPGLSPAGEPPRASAGQAEILTAEAYLAHSAAYVVSWCEHVTGPFDPDLFAVALREIAQRNDVLRTRYRMTVSGIEVTVDPVAEIGYKSRSLPDGADLAAATAIAERAAALPFRLDREHAVRLLVIRLPADEHLVSVMVHHVACDATGLGRLINLVWSRYRGETAEKPPAPQYLDFSAWQQRYLATHGERDRRWWREQLAGAEPLLLPGATRRNDVRPLAGRRRAFDVPAPAGLAVARMCQDRRTTAFAVFSAAYAVALEPYLAGDDVIGTPVTARGLPDFDDTIGFFVNTLPLRLRIPRAGTVADWIAGWTAQCLATLAHRNLPLSHIVREWPRARLPVLFAVNYTLPDLGAGRRWVPLDPGPVKFDLIVSLFGGGASWTGELVHDVTALPADKAEALLSRFLTALDVIVTAPDDAAAALFGEPAADAVHVPDFDLDVTQRTVRD